MIDKHQLKIIIFGRGRMGQAIYDLLAEEQYTPIMLDEGEYDLQQVINYNDVFICATPWFATRQIAEAVSQTEGKLYFDLTEDIEVGKVFRHKSKSILVPHCGLAPGAVSIIATQFLPCHDIVLGVGALPVNPKGLLKYHLTWSTDGLINEYIKPCPTIYNGELKVVNPLDQLLPLSNSSGFGADYEWFTTSGGLGTLHETRFNDAKFMKYKTIRYAGHCKVIKFLLDELEFQQQELTERFDECLPRGGEDKVMIEVNADNRYYLNLIFSKDGKSAIQRTTSAGATAVILWCLDHYNELPDFVVSNNRDGYWIANEDIPYDEVTKYKCWRDVYGEGKFLSVI